MIESTINKAIAAPAEALFDLKFHQVAIYTDNPMRQVAVWMQLGFKDWHHDTAVLVGTENHKRTVKEATMAFNYDIMPLELEYVSYHGRRNSRDRRTGMSPFISHLSTITENIDDELMRIEEDMHGLTPYHQFVTEQHTNPNVQGKKRFREAIYDTAQLFGFDIKLIQRVPWDYEP